MIRTPVVTESFGDEQLLRERRRRTAALVPNLLKFSTPSTLHPNAVRLLGIVAAMDGWAMPGWPRSTLRSPGATRVSSFKLYGTPAVQSTGRSREALP